MGFTSSLAKLSRLEDRIKSIPRAWQKYKSALGMTEKVMDDIYTTVPTDQLKRLRHFCDHAIATVQLKPASESKEFIHIHINDLETVLREIVKEKCIYCFNEGKDIERCRLKKILDTFGIDLKESETLCKYAILKVGE